jgi:hypothetical protein
LNNKRYEEAYNLLSDDFKNRMFPTLEYFTSYVEKVFDRKKVCYIDSYNTYNNLYVCKVRILNDILAEGVSSEYNLGSLDDVYTISEYPSGNFKISFLEFITTDFPNAFLSTDALNISVIRKNQFYKEAEYEIYCKNNGTNTIALSDISQGFSGISLTYDNSEKLSAIIIDNLPGDFIINPNEEKSITLKFRHHSVNPNKPQKIIFEKVKFGDNLINPIEIPLHP